MPQPSDFYKIPADKEAIFENLPHNSALFNGIQNWTVTKKSGSNAQVLAITPVQMAASGGGACQYTIKIYCYYKGIQLQSMQSIQFLNPSIGLLGGSIQIPQVADIVTIGIAKTGTHTGGTLSVYLKEF